jgi:hypothetical protein
MQNEEIFLPQFMIDALSGVIVRYDDRLACLPAETIAAFVNDLAQALIASCVANTPLMPKGISTDGERQ